MPSIYDMFAYIWLLFMVNVMQVDAPYMTCLEMFVKNNYSKPSLAIPPGFGPIQLGRHFI